MSWAFRCGVEGREEEVASNGYDWKRLYGEVGNTLDLERGMKFGEQRKRAFQASGTDKQRQGGRKP